MAKVRRAAPADLDTLVEMARALHAESPQYRSEPFEPQVVRQWLRERMSTTALCDDNAMFVAESGGAIAGVLVAIIVPRWFNRRRVACELTLYVRPEHRGGFVMLHLVRAYKAWAKAQGAAKAMLGVSTGIHPERTVHAYQRLGFTLDGHNVAIDL